MSDRPGPEVAVNARAPFQLAPNTMPMAASSSSAWMNAKFFLPVAGSTRSRSANSLERVHERGGRRDRIPGAHRGAGEHAAKARRGVAVDEDVTGGFRAAQQARRHVHGQRALEVFARVVVAELDGLHVRVHERRLLRVGFRQQFADLRDVEVEQRREHTGVADVLHQDARAHAVEVFVAELRQRHAEHGDVIARQQGGPGPGRVVDQIAAGDHLAHVLGVGLGVHRDHEVDLSRTRDVRIFGDADFVPGGQALDVRREVVLAHDGHAASEDGLHEQRIGAGRTGTVHRRDLDREVIHSFWHFRRPFFKQYGPVWLVRQRLRPWRAATGSSTSACPRPRSGSAPRTDRSAHTGLRL